MRAAFCLLLFSLTAAACAGARYSISEERPPLRAMAAQMTANLHFENETEKAIAREGLYDFIYYLDLKYGAPKREAFLSAWRQSGDFPESLRRTFGKTVYRIGYDMMNDLDSRRAAPDAPLRQTDAGFFRIHYVAGSAAERDLPFITYLLQQSFDALAADFLAAPEVRKRFDESLKELDGRRIHVYLFENEEQAKRHPNYEKATAIMYVKFNLESGWAIPEVGMLFKYYNVLSTSTIVHELTHVAIMTAMAQTPLARIDGQAPDGMERLRQQTNSLIRAGGGALGEGLAELSAGRHNMFYKYGFLKSPDDELRFLDCRGVTRIPLRPILSSKDARNFHMKLLWYHEMHSLAKYITERYGKERFMRLLLSPQADADFKTVLGVSISDLEREWSAGLNCAAAAH